MTAAQIGELVFLEDLLLCTYSSKELLVKDSESGVSLAVCERQELRNISDILECIDKILTRYY